MSINRNNLRKQTGTELVAAQKAAETKTLKKYSVRAGTEDLGFVHAVSEEKALKSARRKFGHESSFAVLRFKIELV